MKEILESIILNMVDNKEAVKIAEEEKDNVITYKVDVEETDMGKVIGKQGKIAKAIRTVMKSIAGKEHKKVTVEFVEHK